MSEFTMDNTDGYTVDQLAELNARFEAAVKRRTDLDPEGRWYKEILQNIAGDILIEFDDEIAPPS